jgi:indole-3-glycerol phosphate synthase
MNFLDKILAHKRREVAARKQAAPPVRLKGMPFYSRPGVSLAGALRGKRLGVIAEIKRASPSRSVIREDFDPLAIAGEYVRGGASAISVLTDEVFFQGHIEYMSRVRNAVRLPILRKDFIIDSYQLYEAKAYGADAVLLIVAALGALELADLVAEARSLGLECLVEVHHESELQLLDLSTVDILGINNRDLATFETDLRTSIRLQPLIPPGTLIVSESGISSPGDVAELIHHHIHAVLIGEMLMKAPRPGEALSALLKEVRSLSHAC